MTVAAAAAPDGRVSWTAARMEADEGAETALPLGEQPGEGMVAKCLALLKTAGGSQ